LPHPFGMQGCGLSVWGDARLTSTHFHTRISPLGSRCYTLALMKPTVFIAMAFAEAFRPGLDQVIIPAINRAGAEAVRADLEMQGHIHSQMFERISESRALVIDLSGLNPNVFYELGVAHTLHRRSIMVVNQKHLDKVPFDIAPYRILVYPDPQTAKPEETDAAVEKLAAEIINILENPATGIPNPVMDFLMSRSPVRATQTLYLSSLKEEDERHIIQDAQHHITYFGLSGSDTALKVIECIEGGSRSARLELRLRLLDPQFETGWRFIKELAESGGASDIELKEFMNEEAVTQRRALKKLEQLSARFPEFKLDVTFYKSIPLFWAYGWDDKKWAVGHYAMRRNQARGLPVVVISAEDPKTTALFEYYSEVMSTFRAPVTPPD
jgi:hypothetical protein